MMMMKKASFFLQEHFLHWAEVLCILGYASEIKGGIETLQSAFKVGFYLVSMLDVNAK